MSLPPLARLRAELLRAGLDGFIVPRADEHLGEYVPPGAERLQWLTGFSGSAGLAVVLAERAAVFTDGRYVLQLAAQTDPALWERRHIIEEPPPLWLAANAPAGARIGYDPMLISQDGLQRFLDAGLAMVAVAHNPIDAVWPDRPAPPIDPAMPYPVAHAGRTSAEKREDIAAALRKAGQDAAIVTDPASLAWLLNIRGSDVPFTPFALGFVVVHADAACDLFMDPAKLPPETRDWLGNAVALWDRAAMPGVLARLAGKKVRVDAAGSPVWFAQHLRDAGRRWSPAPIPACCPRRARTRWSSRVRATRMRATPWRCAASCIGWMARPGNKPKCRRRRNCWRSAPNWRISGARASPPFPAPARTAPSSITASAPPRTGGSRPTRCI